MSQCLFYRYYSALPGSCQETRQCVFCSGGARLSAKRRRAGQRHEDAQHGKASTGLPEGVAHRAHEGADGYHEQAVDHAVHADEGGTLVAGDDIVELSLIHI